MAVSVFCNGKWHCLAGKKIFSNGEWKTPSDLDKIKFQNKWHLLGQGSTRSEIDNTFDFTFSGVDMPEEFEFTGSSHYFIGIEYDASISEEPTIEDYCIYVSPNGKGNGTGWNDCCSIVDLNYYLVKNKNKSNIKVLLLEGEYEDDVVIEYYNNVAFIGGFSLDDTSWNKRQPFMHQTIFKENITIKRKTAGILTIDGLYIEKSQLNANYGYIKNSVLKIKTFDNASVSFFNSYIDIENFSVGATIALCNHCIVNHEYFNQSGTFVIRNIEKSVINVNDRWRISSSNVLESVINSKGTLSLSTVTDSQIISDNDINIESLNNSQVKSGYDIIIRSGTDSQIIADRDIRIITLNNSQVKGSEIWSYDSDSSVLNIINSKIYSTSRIIFDMFTEKSKLNTIKNSEIYTQSSFGFIGSLVKESKIHASGSCYCLACITDSEIYTNDVFTNENTISNSTLYIGKDSRADSVIDSNIICLGSFGRPTDASKLLRRCKINCLYITCEEIDSCEIIGDKITVVNTCQNVKFAGFSSVDIKSSQNNIYIDSNLIINWSDNDIIIGGDEYKQVKIENFTNGTIYGGNYINQESYMETYIDKEPTYETEYITDYSRSGWYNENNNQKTSIDLSRITSTLSEQYDIVNGVLYKNGSMIDRNFEWKNISGFIVSGVFRIYDALNPTRYVLESLSYGIVSGKYVATQPYLIVLDNENKSVVNITGTADGYVDISGTSIKKLCGYYNRGVDGWYNESLRDNYVGYTWDYTSYGYVLLNNGVLYALCGKKALKIGSDYTDIVGTYSSLDFDKRDLIVRCVYARKSNGYYYAIAGCKVLGKTDVNEPIEEISGDCIFTIYGNIRYEEGYDEFLDAYRNSDNNYKFSHNKCLNVITSSNHLYGLCGIKCYKSNISLIDSVIFADMYSYRTSIYYGKSASSLILVHPSNKDIEINYSGGATKQDFDLFKGKFITRYCDIESIFVFYKDNDTCYSVGYNGISDSGKKRFFLHKYDNHLNGVADTKEFLKNYKRIKFNNEYYVYKTFITSQRIQTGYKDVEKTREIPARESIIKTMNDSKCVNYNGIKVGTATNSLFVNCTTGDEKNLIGKKSDFCTIAKCKGNVNGVGNGNVFWKCDGTLSNPSNNAQSTYISGNLITLSGSNQNAMTRFVEPNNFPAGNQDVGVCPDPDENLEGYNNWIAQFGDYHLTSESALIGMIARDSSITKDIEGNNRKEMTSLGAYEYIEPPEP